MRTRAAVSVLTLAAFLPLATGCSSYRTSYVQNDMVTDQTTARLAEGEGVQISGYTTRTDGFHRWKGAVSEAGADSLEFRICDRRPYEWRKPDEPPFRLARADVISLEVQTPDGAKTLGLVGVVVGVLAIGMVVSLAHGLSEGFKSTGSTRSNGDVDWDWGW